MNDHPHAWLVEWLEGEASVGNRLFYDERGNPIIAPTLDELQKAEAHVADLRERYEKAKAQTNRYAEAAAFVRDAIKERA